MRECNFKIRTTLDDAKARYLNLMSPKEEYEWDDILALQYIMGKRQQRLSVIGQRK